MMLETILRDSFASAHALIVFQSSMAQSSLPLLRSLLSRTQTHVVLCNLLYPLKVLTGELCHERLQTIDCTADIPGYSDHSGDCRERLLSAVRGVSSPQSLTIVIDSLDTLLSNLQCKAAAYAFLSTLLSTVAGRPSSRLVIHTISPSMLSVLTTPSFSRSLIHITAHAPALLVHLARSLSAPPPPLSSLEKFWSVFIPYTARSSDIEELAFGNSGEGCGAADEIVVEVLVRGNAGDGIGRRKGIERVLEGWVVSKAVACELKGLQSLRGLHTDKSLSTEIAVAPDPAQNLSFSLTLTAEQHQSRTQVPLPYAHTVVASAPQTGAIFYDPDSADDIDDDDPDEDLDI